MKKTVSVIIPCYNGEKVIDRSIESVYLQDYEGVIELIVIDDGSKDNSRRKIMSWKTKFESKGYLLKYIYQENKGLGGAINTGLKYVTGEYLTLLDADDCFIYGSIDKRAKYLDLNSDYVGVRSNGWQDKQGVKKLFTIDETEKKDTNLFDGLIGGAATNWAGSYMVRTTQLFSFYPDREIYPSRFGQNMQILLPLAYKNKFGFIDEPLMIYYLQDNSHSQAMDPDERIKKDDINFYGYRDIYLHMIDLIVKDRDENKYYRNIIDSWEYKHELKKAMIQNDYNKIKQYYKLYKMTGCMTLNDDIECCEKINIIKAIWLKIYRRIFDGFKNP